MSHLSKILKLKLLFTWLYSSFESFVRYFYSYFTCKRNITRNAALATAFIVAIISVAMIFELSVKTLISIIYVICLLILSVLLAITWSFKYNYVKLSDILIDYYISNSNDTNSIEIELEVILNLLKRDFVLAWYQQISSNGDLPKVSDEVLLSVCQKLTERMKSIDLMALISETVKDLVEIVKIQKTVRRDLTEDFTTSYESKFLKNVVEELDVRPLNNSLELHVKSSLRDVVKGMLRCILDYNDYQCDIGRELFLEVLLQNVFVPLMNLVADPMKLFPLIIYILTNKEPYAFCCDLNLIVEDDYDRIGESDLTDFDNSTNDDFVKPESLSEQGFLSSFSEIANEEKPVLPLFSNSANHVQEKMDYVNRSRETTYSSATSMPSCDSTRYPSNSDPLNLFTEVHVPRTEEVKEMFTKQLYTLYVVQYFAYHDNHVEGRLELRPGSVRRRFREFIALQNRLENALHYRDSLKQVHAPSKFLQLPFRNRARHKVEQRRVLLEKYLQQLIERPEICMSVELKEFLAYEGNPAIAYVQRAKPAVPRVILERTVSGISGVFDAISRTASYESVVSASVSTDEIVSELVEECGTSLDELRFVTSTVKCENVIDRALDKSCSTAVPTESLSQCSWNADLESRLTYDNVSGELSSLILDIISESAVTGGLLQPRLLALFHDHAGVILDQWLQTQVSRLGKAEQVARFLRSGRTAIWPSEDCAEENRHLELPVLQLALEEALLHFFPGWLVQILGGDRVRAVFRYLIESLSTEPVNQVLTLRFFHRLFGEVFPKLKEQNFTLTQ